ncbi:MAG: pentapeptide repeat-containing protein, partial [Deltaproteobacteria bacterium]
MANPEHIAILLEGVEAWNRWREENPDVVPDLAGANLTGAVLAGASLW